MDKIKKWLSVENNFNLIRDCLFILVLLGALFFGYCSLSHTLAAEVSTFIQLPELPTYTNEDSYQDEYVDHQLIVFVNDSYYAVLYSTAPSVSDVCIYQHGQSVNDKRSLYFGNFTKLRQLDVYQLVDDSWSVLFDYPLPGNNGTSISSFGIYMTSAEYSHAVTSDTLIVYSDLPVSASLDGSVHSLNSDKYDVSFGDNVVLPDGSTTPDTGDGTDTPTDPTDPVTPVPPVNPDTDGDSKISFSEAISFMTASIFAIASAFAVFCVSNSIILAGIALFVIGYALNKAKDSMRGV